jgi:hypothetical protein
VVSQAPPTSFWFKGAGLSLEAPMIPMAFADVLDPGPCAYVDEKCIRTLRYVDDPRLGTMPGTDSPGTTYVLGHSALPSDFVFNPLSQYAVGHYEDKPVGMPLGCKGAQCTVTVRLVPKLVGSTAGLETANGSLTYKVTQAFLVSKEETSRVDEIWKPQPGRVVMLTCAIDAQGNDRDFNVVLIAELLDATPKKS